MNLYDLNGAIRCGHRVYKVRKYIVAETAKQALDLFLVEHPHAKGIYIEYKYEVRAEKEAHIVFTNLQKRP